MEQVSGNLRRVLGVGFGIAVTIGAMIGAGILRAPGSVLVHLPSLQLAMLLWIAGGLHAFLGANVIAELMTSVPRSGGLFVPIEAAFGKTWGAVIGWTDWLNMVASVAALSIAASEFCVVAVPWLKPFVGAVAVGWCGIFAAINLLGIKEASRAQIIGGALKGLFLAGLCAAIALLVPPVRQSGPTGAGALSILGALIAYQLIFGVYTGWPNFAYFAEEDKDPAKNIPRSLFSSIAIAMALYLAIVVVVTSVLTVGELQSSDLPISLAAARMAGATGTIIVGAGAALIALSCLNANLMVGSRILYGLSRDGMFPRAGAKVDAAGTPQVAVWITTLPAVVLAATGSFELVFLIMGSLALVPLVIADASLFQLRRRFPDLPRPYRARGYPLLPALALIVDALVLASFMWTDPVSGLSVAAAVLVAIPVALFARRRKAAAAAA